MATPFSFSTLLSDTVDDARAREVLELSVEDCATHQLAVLEWLGAAWVDYLVMLLSEELLAGPTKGRVAGHVLRDKEFRRVCLGIEKGEIVNRERIPLAALQRAYRHAVLDSLEKAASTEQRTSPNGSSVDTSVSKDAKMLVISDAVKHKSLGKTNSEVVSGSSTTIIDATHDLLDTFSANERLVFREVVAFELASAFLKKYFDVLVVLQSAAHRTKRPRVVATMRTRSNSSGGEKVITSDSANQLWGVNDEILELNELSDDDARSVMLTAVRAFGSPRVYLFTLLMDLRLKMSIEAELSKLVGTHVAEEAVRHEQRKRGLRPAREDEASNDTVTVRKCAECRGVILTGDCLHQCFERGCEVFICNDCFESVGHEHRTFREESHSLVTRIMLHGKCVSETLFNTFSFYARRPMFGWRTHTAEGIGNDDVSWLSYGEMLERAKNLARGLSTLKLPENALVGVCGRNCVDWFVADFAACFHALVVVPIHFGLDPETLEALVSNAQLSAVLCSAEEAPAFVNVSKKVISLSKVIVWDDVNFTHPTRVEELEFLDQSTKVWNKVTVSLTHEGRLEFASHHTSIDLSEIVTSEISRDSKSDPNDLRGVWRCGDQFVFRSPTRASREQWVYSVKQAAITAHAYGDAVKRESDKIASVLSKCDSDSSEHCVDVTALSLIERVGRSLIRSEPTCDIVKRNQSPDSLFTIVYSSGSTGTPKGIMQTNKAMNNELSCYKEQYMLGMCHAPLAHSTRENTWRILRNGGRVGIVKMTHSLYDDVLLFEPTIFSAVPRVFNEIFSRFQVKLEQEMHARGGETSSEKIRNDVLAKFRNVLGPRIKTMVTGGAPTSKAVLAFMKELWKTARVHDGYGCMEGGGVSVDGVVTADHVALIDVPEMGYLTSDKPWPRGEICVMNSTMGSGYYRQPELTEKAFSHGWFITGDIGELRDGQELVIIDRRKHLVKLSQGEFVAPERIEIQLLASPFVFQIYCHADTLREHLVCVVVPNRAVVLLWAEKQGLLGDRSNNDELSDTQYETLIARTEVSRKVLEDLTRVAEEAHLQTYEVPAAVHLTASVFTSENGLLTKTGKLSRRGLVKNFVSELESLFGSVVTKHADTTAKLIDMISESVSSGDALRKTQPEGESDSDIPIVELLRGDSLLVQRFMSLVREEFGVQLRPDELYKEKLTSRRLARMVNQDQGAVEGTAAIDAGGSALRRSQPGDWRMSFTLTQADELVDEVIAETKPASARACAHTDRREWSGVFLTGATGFVGVHLLSQLLSECPNATLYCLVRARSEEAATKRLVGVIEEYKLQDRIDMSRVKVICGDLSMKYFALTHTEFVRLSESIHAVVHNGAVVKFMVPFEDMRLPNVGGTGEVVRLCLTASKRVHLCYVSTLSVLSPATWSSGLVRETDSLTENGQQFLGGYGQTKWAAEALVNSVCKRTQLLASTSIVRLGTVCFNLQTGCGNGEAFVHRFLRACVQLGAYPRVDGPIRLMNVVYAADVICRSLVQTAADGKGLAPNASGVYVSHVMQSSSDAASVSDIGEMLRAADSRVEGVDYAHWQALLESACERHTPLGSAQENALKPLIGTFRRGFPLVSESDQYDQSNCRAVEREKCSLVSVESVCRFVRVCRERGELSEEMSVSLQRTDVISESEPAVMLPSDRPHIALRRSQDANQVDTGAIGESASAPVDRLSVGRSVDILQRLA